MKYAKPVNVIACCASDDARVFTRYNKKPADQWQDRILYKTLTSKMVVADYKGTDVNFTIRTMQVAEETTVPTPRFAINMLLSGDSSIKEFGLDETQMQLADYAEACNYAGMAVDKYVPVVQDIASIIKMYATDGGVGNMLIFATNTFAYECVGLIIQLENEVLVVQIKE